ncbi:hypothetical protein ACS0TY_006620 [Phlomoides rotata]
MALVFGTLIKIDVRMVNRKMGQFARLLVEIDMKQELVEKIMYKRVGICSFATVLFKCLPAFCHECGIVGHDVADCTASGSKTHSHRSFS